MPWHKLASLNKSMLVSSTSLLLGSLGARQFFVVEHSPVACSMFSSFYGLHPPDSSSDHSCTPQNSSRVVHPWEAGRAGQEPSCLATPGMNLGEVT